MPPTSPGHPPRARRLVDAVALALAVVLAASTLSGCRPDAVASAPATAQQVVASTPSELTTTAEVGRIVGRLPGTRRRAVRQQVTAVIDRWWERAYLSGDGSALGVTRAFPGFTPGARRRATFDRDLMTNVDLAPGSVTPLMRKVRLDLLAVGRRARSVTARFDLRLRVRSERNRRLRVSGRLFLTHRTQGWQVFGYDVSKGWL